MRKTIRRALVMALFLGAFIALLGTKEANAGARIEINFGLPPAQVFHAPPSVVVIPGTYVYRVPDTRVTILFYNGSWYRPYEGHWYRAYSYNGPWAYVAPAKVPRVLAGVPHYGKVPAGYHRIPYRDLERNWARWQRVRHWDRDKGRRQGYDARDGRGGTNHGRGRAWHQRPEGGRG